MLNRKVLHTRTGDYVGYIHVLMRGRCVATVPLRVTPITIGWIKEWLDKRVKRSCSVARPKKAVQNYRERSIMKRLWISTP